MTGSVVSAHRITIPASVYPSTPPVASSQAPCTQSYVYQCFLEILGKTAEDVADEIAALPGLRKTLFDPGSTLPFRHACIRRVAIDTPSSELDGVIVHGNDVTDVEGTNCSSRRLIFFIPGMEGSYESSADPDTTLPEFLQYFQGVSPEIDVMMINLRGIGESKGSSSHDGWVNDIYAGIQAAIQLGYRPENIAVVGHSLGGWISAQAVQMQHVQNPATQVAFCAYNAPNNAADAARLLVDGLEHEEKIQQMMSDAAKEGPAILEGLKAKDADVSRIETEYSAVQARLDEEMKKPVVATPEGSEMYDRIGTAGGNVSISPIVAQLDPERTRVAQTDTDSVLPPGTSLYECLSESAEAITILCDEGDHASPPGEEVVPWLRQVLNIARVDAAARAVLGGAGTG